MCFAYNIWKVIVGKKPRHNDFVTSLMDWKHIQYRVWLKISNNVEILASL